MEKKRDLDRAVRADPVQFPKRERIENAAYERVESIQAGGVPVNKEAYRARCARSLRPRCARETDCGSAARRLL